MSDEDESPFVAQDNQNWDLDNNDDDDTPFIVPSSIKKAKKINTHSKETKKSKKKKETEDLDEQKKVSRKRKSTENGSSKKKKEEKKQEKKLTKEEKKKEEQEKYEKYYSSGDYNQYPLYASTVHGVNIKKVIEIITPLTPDAVLRFSPDGLSIFGMEQVRMAILSTHFEAQYFHPFKCDQVFEIGIDTQHFSRVLQHVPKYDSLTFYIANKNEPHNLGIIMVNGKKHTFNHTTVVGSETSEMGDIQIPSKEFGGFLEFPASDFQHHIHELFQTATVVTFATNMKDFRMITQGNSNCGQFSPRHIIFYPSTDGVKFTKSNPQFMKKNKSKQIELDKVDDDELPFKPESEKNDDDESPFVLDRLEVGTTNNTENTQGDDSEKEQDEEESSDKEQSIEEKEYQPMSISKMLEDTSQDLGDDYIQATYMLKYINSFTKATQLAKKVVILFQDGGPLILHYQIEMGVITYCLSDISSAADQNRG